MGYSCKSIGIADALPTIADKYESVWAFKGGVWKLYDPVTKKLAAQQSMPRAHGYNLTGEALGGRLYVAGGKDRPSLLDSFGLNPAQGSLDEWSPMSEEEMLEASEPDCRSVEESHLRRVEELEQRAASLK